MSPEYRILPEYTDEAIDASVKGRHNDWADAQRTLKAVPVEWRQSVSAAAWLDSSRTVFNAYGWAENVPTGIPFTDARLRRVAAFRAGERPPRCESVIATLESTTREQM